MTRNVASVEPGADIADATATMMKRRVRRLPVVDDRGNAHGVVALDDIVRNLARQADEVGDLLLDQASRVTFGPERETPGDRRTAAEPYMPPD